MESAINSRDLVLTLKNGSQSKSATGLFDCSQACCKKSLGQIKPLVLMMACRRLVFCRQICGSTRHKISPNCFFDIRAHSLMRLLLLNSHSQSWLWLTSWSSRLAIHSINQLIKKSYPLPEPHNGHCKLTLLKPANSSLHFTSFTKLLMTSLVCC
jgi:hypothetical protein